MVCVGQVRSMEALVAPPLRFATVNPGVTRGGYPTLRNFRYLGRLQLKTVVSLTPEPPTSDLSTFSDMSGVSHFHFSVARNALLNESLLQLLVSVVNILIDPVNHPVYLHCLDGRRVTSLVVLLLRRLQGWTPLSSFSEYWRYQASLKFSLVPSDVEKQTKEIERFAGEVSDVQLPERMPKWLWGGDRSTVVHGVKFFFR